MNDTYQLNPADHNRDITGMTYIYPVVSRRAGGVSIGINLNPNNACNWRCIYCQVPGLTRGTAPAIDLARLESELRNMLEDIVHGSFMQRHVPEGDRQLQDIAFSGNGEPTSASEFPQAVAIVERVLADFGLLGHLRIRLITNGSLADREYVQDGLRQLGRINGEVWFKVDAATREGIQRINDVNLNPDAIPARLARCAELCPTWVQTCMFALDGKVPAEAEIDAYLALLNSVATVIAGVHLYGIARPSMQAEASRLSQLPETWMSALADRIRQLDLTVHVNP